MNTKVSLITLFKIFLKIGAFSWGGHLSLVSMAHKKLVEEKDIISNNLVVESVSLASILPGPVAVNIVAYWGYQLRGWKGAIISAIGVLLPAFTIMLLLSFLYFKYSHIVVLTSFFKGIIPAVAAIIFTTGWSMAKKQKPDIVQYSVMLLAFLLFYLVKGYWISIFLIIIGGIIGIIVYKHNQEIVPIEKNNRKEKSKKYLPIWIGIGIVLCIIISTPLLRDIERQFVFISLSQIGGGYVVIPSMEKIFVDSLHWLSHQEFVDGIALSQITPGPIFIISEFVGYKMNGLLGSIVAVVAVYLPSASLIIFIGQLFQKIQNQIWIKAAFKGIHPVVIGIILSSAIRIIVTPTTSLLTYSLFFVGVFILLYSKVSSPILLIAMGLLGICFFN